MYYFWKTILRGVLKGISFYFCCPLKQQPSSCAMESVNDFHIDYRARCVMQLNGCAETKVIIPWEKKIFTYKCEIGRATSGDTSCKSANAMVVESLQQLTIPIPSHEFSLKLAETKCWRKSWIHSKSRADRGSTFTELLHKEKTLTFLIRRPVDLWMSPLHEGLGKVICCWGSHR